MSLFQIQSSPVPYALGFLVQWWSAAGLGSSRWWTQDWVNCHSKRRRVSQAVRRHRDVPERTKLNKKRGQELALSIIQSTCSHFDPGKLSRVRRWRGLRGYSLADGSLFIRGDNCVYRTLRSLSPGPAVFVTAYNLVPLSAWHATLLSCG